MALTLKEKYRRDLYDEEYICYEFYEDKKLCGDGYIYVGVKNINQFGNLGYHILEEFRHKGYATRACNELMNVLRERNLEEICILVNIDNVYSNKLCKKLNSISVSKLTTGNIIKYKYIIKI